MKSNLLVLFFILTFTLVAFGDDGYKYNALIRRSNKLTVTKTVTKTVFIDSESTSLPHLPPEKLKSFHDNKVSKYCQLAGIKPSNGTQDENGVCSSTPQGEIPKVTNMPSTLILEPSNDAILRANVNFTVKVKTTGLSLGQFSNPDTEYNLFSQTLNSHGHIFGHQHVTVQRLLTLDSPPDSTIFAFFKGLNDAGIKDIQTVVVDRLPPGVYRICTISGSFSHQPLVMPVAKRGSQDDCIRVTLK